MNFQVFHVNPGKKLKKKDVNNDLSHFMSVFPTLLQPQLNQFFWAHQWAIMNNQGKKLLL